MPSPREPSSEPEDSSLKAEGKIAITLVFDTDRSQTDVRMKLGTEFRRAFEGWGKAKNLDYKVYSFIYDDYIISRLSTPKMLEWKAGRQYTVEIRLNKVGGAGP